MNNFHNELNKIHDAIKSFVFFGYNLKSDMSNGEVIGINCSSSSLIRKTVTMERVKAEIERHQVNLEVVEDQPNTRYFQIKLKD
jgi:hypothetical protein